MAVTAVVLDVGETLADETRPWSLTADAVGVPRFTFFGVLGGLAERGEPHRNVYEVLGVESRPGLPFEEGDLYPDARACLRELRRRGYQVGIAGNAVSAAYAGLALDADFIASSAEWGVEKPSPLFFARVAEVCGCPPEKIAYVGDRVDNDVTPALAAGMVAVHIRRGPWGHLHTPPSEALCIRSLDELPGVLA
ncbi:MAG TPA: HAD family hydrolase [Gaiellaceae bacterium]